MSARAKSQSATSTTPVPPHALVVFGASGDLAARKLGPAVAALREQARLPDGFAIVGVARSPMSDAELAERLATGVRTVRYISGGYDEPGTFEELARVLGELDKSVGTQGSRLFYLATPADVFPAVVDGLRSASLNRPAGDAMSARAKSRQQGGFSRLVIEKPFGYDADSARTLDDRIHAAFDESQVYRIDHYLGKETVQNLLALRFANAIFEPIWNRRYVDHMQITVAEALGVEHRAESYERAGALRDIVQNHVLQVLALACMEPPATIDAGGIRDEKVKLLRAVDLLSPEEVARDTVRAQYDAGFIDEHPVAGYREEEGVDTNSATETYVALRLHVDNWRWAGVPFYVRTGKRLAARTTEVAMEFHEVPHLPFKASAARGLKPNTLVLRIQPDEGISLGFGAKVPGQAFEVKTVWMDFGYEETFGRAPAEAYERLLLDAMSGDPTLFIRSDEVECSWRIIGPVLEAWRDPEIPLDRYPAGGWGPRDADLLLARDGRRWRKPA